MNRDFSDDMFIDEDKLEIEWLEQGSLALEYGDYLSYCQEMLTRAEEKVKVIRSKIYLWVLKNPKKYLGDGKITDKSIEAVTRTHKKHLQAKEEWIKAQRSYNDAKNAQWEISATRKAALENMVKLHGQNYFAGPSIPHNLTKERKKFKDTKSESAIGKRLHSIYEVPAKSKKKKSKTKIKRKK